MPLVVAMSTSSELVLSLPTSNESGSPFSSLTMFREAWWPHIGQSDANTTAGTAMRTVISGAKRKLRRFIRASLGSETEGASEARVDLGHVAGRERPDDVSN